MNRWCQKCGKKFTPVGAENKCPDCTGVTIKPKKVKAEGPSEITKICPACGKAFKPANLTIRTCSKKCGGILRTNDWKEKNGHPVEKAKIERKKQEKEPLKMQKCEQCGKEFMPNRPGQILCSQECATAFNNIIISDKSTRKKESAVTVLVNPRFVEPVVEEAIVKEMDMVNNPPHYKLPNGSDAIDVIRAVLTPEEYRGWCKGNALKYQLRAGKKDPTKLVQDLQKAGFFLKELEIYG